VAGLAGGCFRIIHSWKRRYFFFDAKKRGLYYFEDESLTIRKGEIDLFGTVTVERVSEEAVGKLGLGKADPRHAFKIVTDDRTWLLVASTNGELEEWIHTLQSLLR
jgi:hypothetical protein